MGITKPTTFNAQVSATGTPVWRGGDGPVLIVNRDLTNSALIGWDSSVNPTESTLLDPLGSQAFDGKQDLYITAVTGQPQIQVIPGGTQWAPSPAQVAAQINTLGLMKDTTGQTINTTAGGTTTAVNGVPLGISNTGVPLLNKANNLLNSGAIGIGSGGGTHVFGPVSVTQIGYEFFINVLDSAAGNTNPFVQIDMSWTDSATGQVVAQERWTLASGVSSGSGQPYFGTGPSKGDTLTITATNNGTTQVTVQVALNQHSRIYQRDDWRNITPSGGVNGFTNPNGDPAGSILAAFSFNINAATTATRLIPLYAGLVTWSINPTTASTFQMSIHTQDQSGGLANSSIFFDGVTSTGGDKGMLTLPRSVCTLQINNNGGANATFTGGFVIQEQPQ